LYFRQINWQGSAFWRAEFKLNIVRIAKSKCADAHSALVLDLAMWDSTLIDGFQSLLQVSEACHAKTKMVQPDAILVEAVIFGRASQVGCWFHSQDQIPVAQNAGGIEFCEDLESQQVDIKVARSFAICDSEREMMNGTSLNHVHDFLREKLAE
jgi:hypothetical protein